MPGHPGELRESLVVTVENLSARELTRISNTLRGHSIEHGHLTSGHPGKHLNASDRCSVFVKTERSDDMPCGRIAYERESIQKLHAANPATISFTPTPLADTLSFVDDSGRTRELTAWRYVTEHRAPVSVNYLRAVANRQRQIASTPLTGVVDLNVTAFVERIEKRCAKLSRRDAGELLDVAVAYAAKIAELAAERPVSLLHGDLHVGNTMRQHDGTPMIIDWEYLSVGPVEWDAAQLFRIVDKNIRMDAELSATSPLEVAEMLCTVFECNLTLLYACAAFRTVSANSLLVSTGHDPQALAANIRALDEFTRFSN